MSFIYEDCTDECWKDFKHIKGIIDRVPQSHPLQTVSFSDFERNETRVFLQQIENAFFFIERDTDINKSWFDSKIKEIIHSKDRKQVSSNLGEIRAYAILKYSRFGNNLKCESGKGCDFTTILKTEGKEYKIKIEVNTPLGRDNPVRTTIDHGRTLDGQFETGIKETAPFGLPERKGIDSIGSEVISKINSIKEDELQFDNDTINILFVDFVNPFLNEMDIVNGHCKPFQFFNNTVWTGNFWWGMYSQKGEPVFFNKALFYPDRDKPYIMEYDGKLTKSDSKVDFMIFNMYEGLTVLEKDSEHFLKIPKEVYLSFWTLPYICFEDLWINYPLKNLDERISSVKNQAVKIYKDSSFLLDD